MTDSSGDSKNGKLARYLKRTGLFLVALVVILVLFGWAFLPHIAERVIRGMIADAGLSQSELKVVDIGWNEAVIENLSVSDDGWSVKADQLLVSYDPMDLFEGKVKDLEIIGLITKIDLSSKPTDESDSISLASIHTLPDNFIYLDSIRAKDASVVLVNGARQHMIEQIDVSLTQPAERNLILSGESGEYNVLVQLINERNKSYVHFISSVGMPGRFIELIETALGLDDPLMPEGLSFHGAGINGGFTIVKDNPSPLVLNAALNRVIFEGGDTPVKVLSNEVRMDLEAGFTGAGQVTFSGVADTLSLPLESSAGFDLNLTKKSAPKWNTIIAWGDDTVKVSGSMSQLELTGEYDNRPVKLDDLDAKFSLIDGKLEVGGSFSNGGTAIPFGYKHNLQEPSEDRWIMDGELGLGPVKHDKPLPILNAVTDVLENISINGSSFTKMTFSLGSHESFRGTMVTQISDAEIDVSEGKLKASGVNGTWVLHILPLPDDSLDAGDLSHYTMDFSAKELTVASKDALDYDLVHEAEKPVTITGKGNFGVDESILKGEVKNLQLYGEKDGNEILLADTTMSYQMKGDQVHANGKTSIGENVIPFSYWHDRKAQDDKWNLTGWVKIDAVDIKSPVDTGVMIVEAMEGKTIAGKVSMKMDFTIGSDEDFDGVLVASLADGTLTMEDDGPVLEGLSGDIRLSSLKEKKTDGFHRVSAKRIKAFDTEMTNLRLDYKILPNGDIPLRNVALSALGGVVWVDPFVMPGGDDNYQLKVRMKALDLAKLAKLFPDFDGSITGKIDGLLPLQNIDGEFRPVRGGMYLTPRSRAKLRYDVGNKFSAGINPKTEEYKKMKMVEDSLKNLELKVLSVRLFDPRDKDKAIVLKLQGQAPSVPGSPPIHLNINGFKPDDDTVNFFDLLLKHRDKLNFGL